ncbi:TetR/AcrR family transcriptional regulator [Streptococcus sp. UBA4344]|uniref:TetR/AcrR family transcriptional regulator n=1 Tax=Streptococcus sp. UBA4344 TaxID=1947564 RepID=UPI00257C0061|nr:TetR/AcrR family transcriptional regulator [Streptococcus sp. UBA4344]
MAKRQTETTNYLKQALAKLLLEKSFEEITISDLTKTAGVNRGTFYLHYVDKYDMMDQLKHETLNDLLAILNTDSLYTDTPKVITRCLDYVRDNFKLTYALSKSSYSNFSKTVKDFIYNFLLTIPDFKEILVTYYGIPFQYATEVYLSSIESIISLWVNNGGKESTEELTEIILKVASLDKTL